MEMYDELTVACRFLVLQR